jgi:hypothetical protein
VICNEILKIKGYRDSKWNKVTVLLYYSGICLNRHSGTINFCRISENSSIGDNTSRDPLGYVGAENLQNGKRKTRNKIVD